MKCYKERHVMVNTTSELKDVCSNLIMRKPNFIAVDTEFIRNGATYYPKLSLIQIFDGKKSFIIDVLVDELDLSPLEGVMLNKEIIKVFHSCRHDIESLLTVFKHVPTPIFDTQIAAMFCNYYHDCIGYSRLVEQYINVDLDNKAKNSDWSRRPLSDDQLSYAINDVIYLYDLYEILYDKLERSNRIDWFYEEIHTISNINRYYCKDIWKKMSSYYNVNPLTAKTITEWREILAQRYNINRNKIISNITIDSLMKKDLKNLDEILDHLRISTKNVKEENLLEFVDIFSYNEENGIQCENVQLNDHSKSILNLLFIILENQCQENNISRKLVSSKEELTKSVLSQPSNLFHGWRNDFFGKYVKSFMNENLKFEISLVRSLDNVTKIHSKPIENSL